MGPCAKMLSVNRQIPRRLFSHLCRYLVRILFFPVCRVHLARFGALRLRGGFILASNHISHFDPPLIGAWYARYIDWMAMEELFRSRLSAALMHGLCAFPVRRDGTDRRAIREALRVSKSAEPLGSFRKAAFGPVPNRFWRGRPCGRAYVL